MKPPKLFEVPTKIEDRPHCKYCGYDGNYNTMRKYRLESERQYKFPRTIYACDACGHECETENEMRNEIESYKYGFQDYKIQRRKDD